MNPNQRMVTRTEMHNPRTSSAVYQARMTASLRFILTTLINEVSDGKLLYKAKLRRNL